MKRMFLDFFFFKIILVYFLKKDWGEWNDWEIVDRKKRFFYGKRKGVVKVSYSECLIMVVGIEKKGGLDFKML